MSVRNDFLYPNFSFSAAQSSQAISFSGTNKWASWESRRLTWGGSQCKAGRVELVIEPNLGRFIMRIRFVT